MSRLGDLENAIVARLSVATISGSPAFATVQGVSGGSRPAIREAMRRQRMPAAFVAFTEEPTAPEARDQVRGAKFSVLVAAQSLRADADPRNGDALSVGVFQLLDVVRAQLDDYAPSSGLRLLSLQEKFVEADDRLAIYESAYRVWPTADETPSPLFDGDTVVGNDRRLTMIVGPIEVVYEVFSFPGLGGVFRNALSLRAREILWRGEVRASSHATLNTIESAVEARIAGQIPGAVTNGNGQVFTNCVLDRYLRVGGRRDEGSLVIQDAELVYSQLTPLS
jgi:hypothetical protein